LLPLEAEDGYVDYLSSLLKDTLVMHVLMHGSFENNNSVESLFLLSNPDYTLLSTG